MPCHLNHSKTANDLNYKISQLGDKFFLHQQHIFKPMMMTTEAENGGKFDVFFIFQLFFLSGLQFQKQTNWKSNLNIRKNYFSYENLFMQIYSNYEWIIIQICLLTSQPCQPLKQPDNHSHKHDGVDRVLWSHKFTWWLFEDSSEKPSRKDGWYWKMMMMISNTLLLSLMFTVTRLMGGSAGGSMGHAMSNMSGLTACNVSDSKPMQFPLTQRRKRRVLFTQAQVSIVHKWIINL
jgi:hypothetical protein